jgi:hypothetical protein
MENRAIAQKMREAADLLQAQQANPFRVAAYRRAAETIGALDREVRALFDIEGVAGLDRIPNMGRGIASAIAELLITGRWTQLERLRGTLDPVSLFRTVPGVGAGLAQRIHDALRIDSLEALESAAHDGRLEQIEGLGPRRAAAIRANLASMLAPMRRVPSFYPSEARAEPPVAALLAVDREYREKAASGQLPTIAPKRFNPEGKAWLPVLHTKRDAWHFTALYSNTARAHELERTRDWVVIYYFDDSHVEGQRTVVTETRGPLRGQRVVRGREAECRALQSA